MMMKTYRKSIFDTREPIFFLDITMMYTIFLGFENIEFRLKTKRGLDFSFTGKRLFMAKTHQKPVFHPCEAHILARLDITV
jgi:hypothetical protein